MKVIFKTKGKREESNRTIPTDYCDYYSSLLYSIFVSINVIAMLAVIKKKKLKWDTASGSSGLQGHMSYSQHFSYWQFP